MCCKYWARWPTLTNHAPYPYGKVTVMFERESLLSHCPLKTSVMFFCYRILQQVSVHFGCAGCAIGCRKGKGSGHFGVPRISSLFVCSLRHNTEQPEVVWAASCGGRTKRHTHTHTVTDNLMRERWVRAGVNTGHRDSAAKRQPGDNRIGTVAMETQAAEANHGNW